MSSIRSYNSFLFFLPLCCAFLLFWYFPKLIFYDFYWIFYFYFLYIYFLRALLFPVDVPVLEQSYSDFTNTIFFYFFENVNDVWFSLSWLVSLFQVDFTCSIVYSDLYLSCSRLFSAYSIDNKVISSLLRVKN